MHRLDVLVQSILARYFIRSKGRTIDLSNLHFFNTNNWTVQFLFQSILYLLFYFINHFEQHTINDTCLLFVPHCLIYSFVCFKINFDFLGIILLISWTNIPRYLLILENDLHTLENDLLFDKALNSVEYPVLDDFPSREC